MSQRHVLITGAGSAIARAVAERLAAQGGPGGVELLLPGRDVDDATRTAADLRLRFGVRADAIAFDATALDAHAGFVDACVRHFGGELDTVIAVHGAYADQADAGRDPVLARRLVEVNYLSMVSLLEPVATYFEQRRSATDGSAKRRPATIAAVSSVAGDRGRKSNYLYGSTKAALNCYLAGLRHRLGPAGVNVLTIKPGLVDTKLTWGMPGSRLLASPDRVGHDIVRAIRRGRRGTLYTPWFWRFIMAAIRSIPEPVFKRLDL